MFNSKTGKQQQLNQLAKDILRTNRYMTLATCDGKKPWAAPVFYCLDDSLNCYFISQPKSRHGRHIASNPHVSFAIFDSHQPEGTGNGIQGYGQVKELKGNTLREGLTHYHTSFIKLSEDNLTKPAPYRLYKLQPQKLYVLDPEAETDQRIRIQI